MADVKNITSSNPGRNGVMFRGLVGTELPTNAFDDLDEGFKDQGIVGEDGVSQAISRDTTDIKSYGGDVVYTLQNDYGVELTLTLYESRNVETLKTAFGDENVTSDENGNIKIVHNKKKLPKSSFVFEHELDDGVKRQVIEVGQIINVGDIANVHSDIVKFDLTLKAFPDGDGNVMLEYIANDSGGAALQIATGILKQAKEAEQYNAKLVAVGGAGGYKFTAVGQMPAGLQLAEDGTISGEPSAAGEKDVTVKVTDTDGKSVQKTLKLTIAAKAS